MRFVLAAGAACLVAGAAATACHRSLPPIVARPMPAPDGRPARLPSLGERPLSDRLASYRIQATFDAPAHLITGHETLSWRNNGHQPVSEAPLHLYMNAFTGPETRFMRHAGVRHGEAPDRPGDWGAIEVTSIKLGGVDLLGGAKAGDEDRTVLVVPLPHPVAPGELLELELTFKTRLPQVIARTGFEGDFTMVGQWFPKIGVLVTDLGDETGQRWHAAPYDANTEFFADFGTYDVELTVPDTHVVAATGVLTAARAAGPGMRTLTYRAEDVHDFAWMADPHMKILRGMAHTAAGDVEVRVYHPPGHEAFAARHLAAGRRSIEMFSRLFAPYAWPIMSIVDPPWEAMAGAGGMEYPTLVTVGADLDVPGQRLTEEVTIHEVAHNWFQGMLASDEVEEPYLDEGMTEYVTGLVADDMFGPHGSVVDTPFLRLGYYEVARIRSDSADTMAPTATAAYAVSSDDYGEIAYHKPCQTMKTLEGMVGRDRLLDAIGLYARRNAFHHPRLADLFAALRDGLGEDLGWFLEPAYKEVGGVDLRVGPIVTRKLPGAPTRWSSEVTIERPGRYPVRVQIHLRFADGSTADETWDARQPMTKLAYERPSELVGVTIDPAGLLTLERRALDDAVAPPNPRPALRAGARAGFWLQTAASLVGL